MDEAPDELPRHGQLRLHLFHKIVTIDKVLSSSCSPVICPNSGIQPETSQVNCFQGLPTLIYLSCNKRNSKSSGHHLRQLRLLVPFNRS